jgi:hypothetical protein
VAASDFIKSLIEPAMRRALTELCGCTDFRERKMPILWNGEGTGSFEFDAVSANGRVVACLSTARTLNPGQRHKLMRDATFMWLVPNVQRRILAVVETAVADALAAELRRGRLPPNTEIRIIQLDLETRQELERFREAAVNEVGGHWIPQSMDRITLAARDSASQAMTETERRKALGDWGEAKALELMKRSGSSFANARDVNAQTHNHPFGDIYAERGSARFLIGVKTRCMYQKSGDLNPTYNVRKKGHDVAAVARPYKADLGWVAIQVVPEIQTFNAYFGTIAQIEDRGERFSIPMQPQRTPRYIRLGQENEFDPSIRLEWSNGGYPARNGR